MEKMKKKKKKQEKDNKKHNLQIMTDFMSMKETWTDSVWPVMKQSFRR